MSDEELSIPAKRVEVVDTYDVPNSFTDWFITAGNFDGIVNIALGAIEHSIKKTEDSPGKVVVTCRLRMSSSFAARLHAVLGNVIGIAPSDNPESSPGIPKNQLN